jgi:glutamyl-tRNA reductase
MKKYLILLPVLVFIGCFNNTPKTAGNNQNSANDSIAKIDSINTIYLKDMNTYKEKMADTLILIDKKIDEFKAKLEQGGKQAKAEYKKDISDLQQRGKELKKKLDEYSEKGKDKWEKFKKDFDRDMDTLSRQFKDLTSDKTKS